MAVNPSTKSGVTEEYNGSAWTEETDLNTARSNFGAVGTHQTAAYAAGGS